MASTASELAWNAGYGQLPFDLFILDRWESTAPALPTDHRQHWDGLVREYLSLTLVERWPWYKRVRDALSEVRGADPLPSPTEEQIGIMFTPHQSIQERNLSAKFCCGWNIVWLRTCYTPALGQKYLELEQTVGARVEGGCLESQDQILDDASLYAFNGTDQEILDQLLLRLPSLTDAKGIQDEYGDGSFLLYGNGKNDPEAVEQSQGEDDSEIKTVALDVQNVVYVVDDEAVRKNIVKVWWFDEFGKIVWDNIAEMPGSNLDGVLGAMMDGQGFADLVGEDSQRGDAFGS